MRKVARKVRNTQKRSVWRVQNELETADYIAGCAVIMALITFISFFRIYLGA